jgi:hypothetical protein
VGLYQTCPATGEQVHPKLHSRAQQLLIFEDQGLESMKNMLAACSNKLIRGHGLQAEHVYFAITTYLQLIQHQCYKLPKEQGPLSELPVNATGAAVESYQQLTFTQF